MRYWPNPAHKRETTEAGPPRWRPNKEPCPPLRVDERNALLITSIAADPGDPHSRRYALRRGGSGLELYEAKWTRDVDGDPEFHGHPTAHVPGAVLRRFLGAGHISAAGYERLRKELG